MVVAETKGVGLFWVLAAPFFESLDFETEPGVAELLWWVLVSAFEESLSFAPFVLDGADVCAVGVDAFGLEVLCADA